MKKFSVLAMVIVAGFMANAQPGQNGRNMNGRFYGKIVEASSNKGIEAASVQLLQNRKDSATGKFVEVVVNGMLTAANGDFNLENVPLFGKYKLRISAIGFKELEQPVSFQMKPGGDMSSMLNAVDRDLGNIKLEIDEKVMGNVTVTSSKPLMQMGIDRKIFNVDKNLVSTGGSAVDVMKNIPSLNVDIDGNVSLRNSSPQIFVDGRPTTMTLEQIPADAIESVEIITNPSAKFDASGGTAGILNIVLKKNRKVGYSGNLRTNLDTRAKMGLGGDINLRQDKVNLFVNGMYNQRKSISTGTTMRRTMLGSSIDSFFQDDRSIHEGYFAFARGGMDYFINNRNTLTLSGTFVNGTFKPSSTSSIWSDNWQDGIDIHNPSLAERTADREFTFRNRGAMLGFKHNFPRAGREFTADINFNKSRNESYNLIRTDSLNINTGDIENSYSQVQEGGGDNMNLVAQADYVNPINENMKFEMGVRTSIRKVDSRNNFFNVNSDGSLTPVPDLSSLYKSLDQVHAAYGTWSGKKNNFGYQLGIRVESSSYEGELPDKDQSFEIDFPVSVFPSFFLSQQLKNDQDLQFNYSRRINRPGFWQLFPFTDYSDTLNLSRGNPALNPEFTNSLELSYQKTFENRDNFLASVYFKHTDDLITRYQEQEQHPVSGKDVLVNTYINANSSYVTGLELIGRNKITKWWELKSNLNLYTSKIDLEGDDQLEMDQFASWFAKVNNTFRLPKNITLQISADYQSKSVLPPGGTGGGGGRGGGMFGGGSNAQGYVRANFGVDAGLRYEFLKERRASISINFNDIFRTRLYDSHTESPYFIQDAQRRRDAQVGRISFNWRFGKFDAALFKRKNTRGEREGMNNMNDGMNF